MNELLSGILVFAIFILGAYVGYDAAMKKKNEKSEYEILREKLQKASPEHGCFILYPKSWYYNEAIGAKLPREKNDVEQLFYSIKAEAKK